MILLKIETNTENTSSPSISDDNTNHLPEIKEKLENNLNIGNVEDKVDEEEKHPVTKFINNLLAYVFNFFRK